MSHDRRPSPLLGALCLLGGLGWIVAGELRRRAAAVREDETLRVRDPRMAALLAEADAEELQAEREALGLERVLDARWLAAYGRGVDSLPGDAWGVVFCAVLDDFASADTTEKRRLCWLKADCRFEGACDRHPETKARRKAA